MKTYLQWYRDRGKGQQASTELKANETMLGSWPLAQLPFTNSQDREEKWNTLYNIYGINAMSFYT
jgi:hypothetical protein